MPAGMLYAALNAFSDSVLSAANFTIRIVVLACMIVFTGKRNSTALSSLQPEMLTAVSVWL